MPIGPRSWFGRRAEQESPGAPEAPGAQRLLDAGVFDQEFYEAQVRRTFSSAVEAARDYLHAGAADRSPHPLVDLASIPAGPRAAISRGHAGKLLAYLRGTGSRRGTGPLFDATAVLDGDPDHPGGLLGWWLTTAGPSSPLPGRNVTLEAARRVLVDALDPPGSGTAAPPRSALGARVSIDARADVVKGGVLALEAARSVLVDLVEVRHDRTIEQVTHLAAQFVGLPAALPVSIAPPTGPEDDGRVLVVVDAGVSARAGWLDPLLARVGAEGVVGVQPLVLDDLDLVHPRSGLTTTGYPLSGPVDPVDLDTLLAPVRALRAGTGRRVLVPESVVSVADRAPTRPEPARTAVVVAARPPALRWGLRIASPPGAGGDTWGDTHFANSLAAALRRLGQEVVVHRHGGHDAPAVRADHVALTIRGLDPVVMAPGALSVLWVISHPDDVALEELAAPDLVYAASEPWAARASERSGRPVLPLLQATDLTLAPDLSSPVGDGAEPLFVGVTNARRPRPIVLHAVGAGVPVIVYGPGWARRVPAEHVRSSNVPNDELLSLYRRHGLVLADHWGDMAEQGFLANRLFDAVAAGARVVSDAVPGTEVFEGAVQTYRTPEELARLCSAAGRAEFPDPDALDAIALRVRAEHSFDRRAIQLLDGVTERLSRSG